MNIEIKIELDKELAGLIHDKFDKVSEKIIDLVNIFEKFITEAEDTEDESTPAKAQEKTLVKNIVQNQQSSAVIDNAMATESKKTKITKNIGKQNNKTEKSSSPSKKSKTALGTIFDTIKQSNGGINVDDLKKKTGFASRKVADAVYRLKKNGKIDKTDEGLYIALQ